MHNDGLRQSAMYRIRHTSNGGYASLDEWDTSQLPESRRAYLNGARSFEAITEAAIAEAEILKLWPEECRYPPRGGSKDLQRICGRIRVSNQTYDLLYNAPDGIRGRYWQSPDAGDLATRFLTDAFEPTLLKFAEQASPIRISGKTIELEEVRASLHARSAKVWVREKDDADNTMIALSGAPQLRVRRWEQNESHSASKGPLWRWTPCENEIEIKGAFVDPTGFEYIPEGKRHRSSEIHLYGFT